MGYNNKKCTCSCSSHGEEHLISINDKIECSNCFLDGYECTTFCSECEGLVSQTDIDNLIQELRARILELEQENKELKESLNDW